jgi:hypothetical protein
MLSLSHDTVAGASARARTCRSHQGQDNTFWSRHRLDWFYTLISSSTRSITKCVTTLRPGLILFAQQLNVFNYPSDGLGETEAKEMRCKGKVSGKVADVSTLELFVEVAPLSLYAKSRC